MNHLINTFKKTIKWDIEHFRN